MADSNLNLRRIIFTDVSTIGDLVWEGGEFICNTLEDTCRRRDKNKDGRLQREEKVYGQTAIPSGRYEIKMELSGHFKRKMPFLYGYCVGRDPNNPKFLFNDVMIHWGNWSKQTLGCILVGKKMSDTPDFISESQKNYNDLEPRILEALSAGRLFINIEGGLKP